MVLNFGKCAECRKLTFYGNIGNWQHTSEIYQRLTYHFPLGGVITELRINETKMFSTTIAGFIDRQRNGKETPFASEKGTWQDVIVQVNLKIILTTGMVIVSNK